MKISALNESAGLRYGTFFYLYLMQGIPAGFGLTAMANYLAGKQVGSQAVGTFVAVTGLPWVLQFIWGPIIDRYQYSIIGHRKHWVVLTQVVAVIASLSLLIIKDPVQQLGLMSTLFFIHSIFASIQDASVDAIAIAVVPTAERGRINAFMRGGFLLGMAIGAAGLSYILHNNGFSTAVLLQSGILFLFTLITFFIKLDRHDPLLPRFGKHIHPGFSSSGNPTIRSLFKSLHAGIMRKTSLRNFGIIAGVYLCFSIFIRSYTYHLIDVLKWPDQSVSLLQGSWGSVLTFAVIICGGILSDRVGARVLQLRVMWIVGIFLLLLNGLFFLWNNHFVTSTGLVLWSFADPLFSVASFPILMSFCVKQVEGSQFTAYMALINFCDVMGSYITGWALTVVAAPLIGFGCGITVLVLILFFRKINRMAGISLPVVV